jgi:Mg2+-importing ATPase
VALNIPGKFRKIDEVPFDFVRKRMSVVVAGADRSDTIICKGAVEELMELCTHVEVKGYMTEMLPERRAKSMAKVSALNAQGFRVVALAYKTVAGTADDHA